MGYCEPKGLPLSPTKARRRATISKCTKELKKKKKHAIADRGRQDRKKKKKQDHADSVGQDNVSGSVRRRPHRTIASRLQQQLKSRMALTEEGQRRITISESIKRSGNTVTGATLYVTTIFSVGFFDLISLLLLPFHCSFLCKKIRIFYFFLASLSGEREGKASSEKKGPTIRRLGFIGDWSLMVDQVLHRRWEADKGEVSLKLNGML